jgi:hypothetical protein
MGCVLSREVWATCLRWWGKLLWMPQMDSSFVAWLQEKRSGPGGDRDLWTGVALVCCCLWRHHNDIVFERAAPSKDVVFSAIAIEAEMWRIAGIFRGSFALVDK